ncbi:MAG: CDP-alcohol phosphatidyltransferase family protein [Chloroflexi bacterium]|nr:CDP-alcohol phosphatidyltransferase family protein [Chloroflexota bacterium]
MARLQKNRSRYEALGQSLSKHTVRIGLSPNQLTLISFGCAIGAGVAIAYRNLLLALLGIALMGLFDALDGSVARATGRSTQFGGVFDHAIDRYAEMALLLGGDGVGPGGTGVGVARTFRYDHGKLCARPR